MRIENLYSVTNHDSARVAATVIWEDNAIPTREIYFETDVRFASDFSCNPHAFLIACLLPAIRHREERIKIDEEICPELRNGLMNAMALIHKWYYPQQEPVRIESRTLAHPVLNNTPRAGSFLSGGIDSLAILRTNRLNFPIEHPLSIKDCLLVHGFDIGGYENQGKQNEHYEQAYDSLFEVTRNAEVTLIPVYTNIRHLDDDVHFWEYEFFGAALSAVAQIFSRRFSTMSIASTYDIHHIKPHGSHPLLDPYYSSAGLRIRHDGIKLSRLEKVNIVSDWEVALQNIRVCTIKIPGMLNCGKCEKCIRTMLELLVIGKLEKTLAFSIKNVSKEMLRPIFFRNEAIDSYYLELVNPLTAINRLDLVEVIKEKSAHFHKHLDWIEERDWKGIVKRFDRRYLGGKVTKFRDQFKSEDVLAWQAQERKKDRQEM